ncbi:MAG: diapophytoene dehydrogenase [Segetibacter sp.]|nr:diapophytoene dehydrogenase [Segetibacter sp.]
MALVDLVMPKLGESIMEATVLKWTKKVGENVKQDETVLEIATDKVDSEVPSTTDGVLAEILFNENEVIPIGTVIARIETDAQTTEVLNNNLEVIAENNMPEEPFTHEIADIEEYVPHIPKITLVPPAGNGSSNNKFYSPLVINIANSEGISMSELDNIPGTGNEGRVTKKDILQYVADKKEGKLAATPPQQPAEKPEGAIARARIETITAPAPKDIDEPAPSYTTPSGNVEIIEMDRMRKMIAKHMVTSKQVSPHVTSFSEADVTNMVRWREKVKSQFEKLEGTKITYTPMFIACVTRVIKRFPYINCSVEGDRIILKKDINIGMATALPSGSLIVPVIKNADYLNLVGLSKSVNSLAENARNNRLKPDDINGGTFTVTNVGTFGSLMGTPIINQPQVAILAVGAIKKRPMVIETPEGDSIGIRHMMYLSLSYDHRVVDGSVGASFLTEVAKEFENWDINSKW